MQKKYIVRLTDQEREVCQQTVRKLNGSNEKVRRAQILLKADADGQAWTDQQVADALSCRTKTIENIRQRCVLEGFERALERKRRPSPPVPKLLDGEQEAQVIALRLGSPPKGYANWSLRLLARRVVELQIVERGSAYARLRPGRRHRPSRQNLPPTWPPRPPGAVKATLRLLPRPPPCPRGSARGPAGPVGD